jgi:hypothetical protein
MAVNNIVENMSQDNNEVDDGCKAHVEEHLFIVEVETGKVLINQRGQTPQQINPVENEEDDN